MRFLIGSALAIALLFAKQAEAVSCQGKTFAAKEAVMQLSTLNSYLVRQDFDEIKERTAVLEVNLPCMKTPAPPQLFATAYRYIGIGYYYEGNEEAAKKWFRTALELDPNHKWGVSEIKTSDPLYAVYEDARNDATIDPTVPDGRILKAPEGTVVYVDGRVWKEPGLTPDRPHIVFIASRADRHIIDRFVVDGSDLPPLLLADGERVSGEEDVSAEDMFAVTKVKRVRPPAKTPLLVSSLTTLVAAGGVYGYTFSTNQQFFDATTTADKQAIRQRNNGLVVTSIAIGTVGLGVGYAGMIIDAPNRPMIPWQL